MTDEDDREGGDGETGGHTSGMRLRHLEDHARFDPELAWAVRFRRDRRIVVQFRSEDAARRLMDMVSAGNLSQGSVASAAAGLDGIVLLLISVLPGGFYIYFNVYASHFLIYRGDEFFSGPHGNFFEAEDVVRVWLERNQDRHPPDPDGSVEDPATETQRPS